MGLSTGYMGCGIGAQRRLRVWDAALFSSGVTVLAFAAYGVIAGMPFTSARTVGPALAAIAMAFAAHYLVAKFRASREMAARDMRLRAHTSITAQSSETAPYMGRSMGRLYQKAKS